MRIEQEQEMKRMEYEQALQHVRAQALNQQQVMNTAQNAIQNSPYQQGVLGSGYQSGWNDPRGMMNAASSSPSIAELYENVKKANYISKELMHKIERTEKKVEMLSGFYTWITEVYPEIAAQHKAMRDLYEAANSGETQPEKEA
jgi:type II secretory pathway pseudopilin PulG